MRREEWVRKNILGISATSKQMSGFFLAGAALLLILLLAQWVFSFPLSCLAFYVASFLVSAVMARLIAALAGWWLAAAAREVWPSDLLPPPIFYMHRSACSVAVSGFFSPLPSVPRFSSSL